MVFLDMVGNVARTHRKRCLEDHMIENLPVRLLCRHGNLLHLLDHRDHRIHLRLVLRLGMTC